VKRANVKKPGTPTQSRTATCFVRMTPERKKQLFVCANRYSERAGFRISEGDILDVLIRQCFEELEKLAPIAK
jgi:hypothetical protein